MPDEKEKKKRKKKEPNPKRKLYENTRKWSEEQVKRVKISKRKSANETTKSILDFEFGFAEMKMFCYCFAFVFFLSFFFVFQAIYWELHHGIGFASEIHNPLILNRNSLLFQIFEYSVLTTLSISIVSAQFLFLMMNRSIFWRKAILWWK